MIETLLRLGLSEKEAKVYLAALELGSAPASKIAQKSGLNRPTTYVILEKLSNQGLVTSYDKGKVQFFTAEDPEQLARLIREQERDLELRANELKDKLPELKALFGGGERPKVYLYDSTSGASNYFYSRLKQGDDIYGFTNYDEIKRIGAEDEDPQERLRKNVTTHLVYTSLNGPVKDATSKTQLREAKFVEKKDFSFESSITVAPKRGVIFMLSPKTNTSLVIDNPQLAESLKAIFDLIWNKI